MQREPVGQYLEWDSDFFGRRIGRVTANRLSPAIMGHVNQWCRAERMDCAYFLANGDDTASVRLAEDHGFHLVDLRVTMEFRMDASAARVPASESVRIRTAVPEDIPHLRACAKVSHHDSRFYHDPEFPRDRCDELYATWIEKSCRGDADTVKVAEWDGRAAGYVTCKRVDGTVGQIGLAGVVPEARGHGLARALVAESLRWFRDQSVACVVVVTQGRNFSAQRLYQKCGFMICNLQFWYHRWFTAGPTRETP